MDDMELRAVCLGAAARTANAPEQMIRQAFAYELYLYGGAQVALDHLNAGEAAPVTAAVPAGTGSGGEAAKSAQVVATDDAPDVVH